MMEIKRNYGIDVRSTFTTFDQHYDKDTFFGSFSEDGKTYTVINRETPRQWLNMLYNKKFASVVSNKGEGYTVFGGFYNRVTRYFNSEFYIVRDVDGKRTLKLYDMQNGDNVNLFDNAAMICQMKAGAAVFKGTALGIEYRVEVFVPTDANCECWLIFLKNNGQEQRELKLCASQTWTFHNHFIKGGKKQPCDHLQITQTENGYIARADEQNKPFDTMFGGFAITNISNAYLQKRTEKTLTSKKSAPAVYKDFKYTDAYVYTDILLPAGATACNTVVSAASDKENEVTACIDRFMNVENAKEALAYTLEKIDNDFSKNSCILPDKNLERFLNTWLKYQLGLTYRYNRNSQNGGFRDVLQDSWGAMLIYPEYSKERMLEALSHLYQDGHSMRGYDSYGGLTDGDDFVDCPLWAPCTVAQYIKETGDFDVLDTLLPYFDSDTAESVETHLWKLLEYAYTHRGTNGLLLMRDGDWLDGLSGINQKGTATSAWATMQVFWAGSIMIELYRACGKMEKADILEKRNEEYRTAVREAAWDGEWYVYGFKSDGFPVGSRKCKEGKIYINPQTWAILTGIETDPARIASIRRAVNTYLSTPFGPLLNYPPYVNDTTCGRIYGQVPGTFANAATYLHAGTFKIYSDIAANEIDEAYDTFMRLLPNHIDNPDSRRTSEPWCTGNVHFGPDSPAFGMNLFSWFTATPAWLIHAGFEEMIGIKAGYDGLYVNPRVPHDWNEFSSTRIWRQKSYTFDFHRAKADEAKGIYRQGAFYAAEKLDIDAPAGNYSVIY